MNITLEQAEKVLKALKAKAQKLKVAMDIAVVDSGTNLVAFARMDNAWLGSIDIAMKKARTARYFISRPVRSVNCPSPAARYMASSIPTAD